MARTKIITLTAPTDGGPDESPKWYEQYPRLNSARFSAENSGARAQLLPPYELSYADGRIVGIEGHHGLSELWVIVGFTESPPFSTDYPAVALMFESVADFEQIWWHYPLE